MFSKLTQRLRDLTDRATETVVVAQPSNRRGAEFGDIFMLLCVSFLLKKCASFKPRDSVCMHEDVENTKDSCHGKPC